MKIEVVHDQLCTEHEAHEKWVGMIPLHFGGIGIVMAVQMAGLEISSLTSANKDFAPFVAIGLGSGWPDTIASYYAMHSADHARKVADGLLRAADALEAQANIG